MPKPAAEIITLAGLPRSAPKAAPKAARPLSKRAQQVADALAGKPPSPPDFSAATHRPYLKRHAQLVALVEAGDLESLYMVDMLRPCSSSLKALHHYRTLAILALEAQRRADERGVGAAKALAIRRFRLVR